MTAKLIHKCRICGKLEVSPIKALTAAEMTEMDRKMVSVMNEASFPIRHICGKTGQVTRLGLCDLVGFDVEA